MTDEAIVETPVEEKVEEFVNAAPEKTPQEKNQDLQGKKTIEKKKIKAYTKEECQAEIKRLDKTGQQHSRYYIQIANRLQTI